jgi:hypothetical protein
MRPSFLAMSELTRTILGILTLIVLVAAVLFPLPRHQDEDEKRDETTHK